MMTSSMFFIPARLVSDCRDETRIVRLLSISAGSACRSNVSAAFHKAHPHPRGIADGLAGESLGAGPRQEAGVVVGAFRLLLIAMRAPAVVIFGAGEFRAAAQLRTIRKSAGIIRRRAV